MAIFEAKVVYRIGPNPQDSILAPGPPLLHELRDYISRHVCPPPPPALPPYTSLPIDYSMKDANPPTCSRRAVIRLSLPRLILQ